MSTKISNLTELLQADIVGDEFFPIIDGGTGDNTATSGYQTYKIKLDALFASGQGHEKVTDLVIVQGEHETDTAVVDGVQLKGNEYFTLEYTQEDGQVRTRTIQKYKLQNDDVDFRHIDPAGYINSTQRISNNNSDQRLTTPAAVIEHVNYKEDLLFDNSDSKIKEYYGDSTTARGNSATHILNDFRLNSEVADDFANLLDGVKAELNTFKKIEEEFDLTTVDRNTKIGTDQVNLDHFRINTEDDSNRLNIKDLGIVTNLIGNNAITSVKIRDKAVLNSKIVDEAITTSKIIDDAVTTDKIIDEAVTPAKLSGSSVTPPLSPSWDETAVNIPRSLSVSNNITADGDVSLRTTLSIYNSDSRGVGASHEGRALVHTVGDILTINHLQDFTGGVNIKGTVVVPDQSLTAVRSNPRGVATKEYVDDADIRIRPLDPSRVGDDCIQLRHMSPDSVDTEELIDFCVTDPKVELIGPHWDSTGTVRIYNELNVAGNKLEVGEIGTTVGDKTEITLRSPTSTLNRGMATITRLRGDNANLSIKNIRGDITFNTGSANDLTITSNRVFVPKTLTISGDGSTTIAGTNFGNPPLLVGNSSQGIAVDQNEIMQKGNHLILGVADGASQDIIFKQGGFELATIYGNTGNFSTLGDIISETGVIRRNGDTADLTLRGGTTNANGANIQLYAVNNAANSNQAIYDADFHYFQNVGGAGSNFIIDSKNRKVTLATQGTARNHLINKAYVDDKKIAPTDLTPGGPQWDTTTVTIPNDLGVINVATIGDNLSVGGHILLTGTDFKIYNTTRADGNIHAGRALVHDVGDKLSINHLQDFTGGVNIRGPVIAPDQTIISTSNNQALTTKKYVDAEILKVYPDDRYVRREGDNMTGDLTWYSQSGKGLVWSNDTDAASIKFYTDGDSSLDNRLEFNIRDNTTENFVFTHTNTSGNTFELLKVGANKFQYKGYNIWHDGNRTMPNLSPYAKTSALSAYSLTSHHHDNKYAKRSHGHSEYLTSASISGYATQDYVNGKIGGFASRSYVDTQVSNNRPVRSYHIDLTASLKTSADDNNSYISPSSKVLSTAKTILPNLQAGDRVSVSWGYKINAGGNGSGTFYASQVSVYNVNSSTDWTRVGSGSATRMS